MRLVVTPQEKAALRDVMSLMCFVSLIQLHVGSKKWLKQYKSNSY